MAKSIGRPKGFVLNTEYYMLKEKVFDLVTCESASAIAPVNRSLKRLGAFVRLYYHIIWVYKDQIDENPDFIEAVYQVETLRRDIQKRIDDYGHPLGNGLCLQLFADSNAVNLRGDPIVRIYDNARDWCLSREIPSRFERLRKIYSILDAEKDLFIGFPKTKWAYKETGKTYLDAALSGLDTRTADALRKQMAEGLRATVKDSLPQINGKPIPQLELPVSPT